MYPELYVIAGPNGIGKTTSSFDLVPLGVPIINSDEIAAAVRSAGYIKTNSQEYSNREASRLMNEYLEKRESFVIETNLADRDTWKFLIEIQKSGYKIKMIYLSTDNLALLNARIDQRVLAGEHFVRPDIVEERYVNSLSLLNHYFNIPDHLQLFDNSKSLQLIAEIKKGNVQQLNSSLPDWVADKLSVHFSKNEIRKEKKIVDMDSVEEVRKRYQEFKKKAGEVPQKKNEINQDKISRAQTNSQGKKHRLG